MPDAGTNRRGSLWLRHGEEIIAILLQGIRPYKIAETFGVQQPTLLVAINRYYTKLGIPADDAHDRNVLFVLRKQPLRKEIEELKLRLREECCPYPDLHCPHQGRKRAS